MALTGIESPEAKPLVSRPGYGEGHPALPVGNDTTSVSKLPEGAPAEKGLSLDPSIPGEKTFAKPVDDIREDKPEPGSIYRQDTPGDMAKPQDNRKQDEQDMTHLKPRYEVPGGHPSDDASITPYPYRDGVPNTTNASAEFVAGMWALRSAHEVWFPAGGTFETRTAMRMETILQGLNPKVQDRASKCSSTLKRADPKNLRWIFSVDCGNGAKVVKMQAVRKGNVVRLGRMDLVLSCSCPAWRWLGSEFHAVMDEFIDGKPRGTASVPVIRDPELINRVCKHVASALSLARDWEIPLPKRKAKPVVEASTLLDLVRIACRISVVPDE